MTFSIGWTRISEDGVKQRVDFDLIRDKATWKYRPARAEPRVAFEPSPEDWDALFEVLDRHLQRGKVTHIDYKIVQKLHERSTT